MQTSFQGVKFQKTLSNSKRKRSLYYRVLTFLKNAVQGSFTTESCNRWQRNVPKESLRWSPSGNWVILMFSRGSQNDILHMKFSEFYLFFPQFLWTLTFIFSGSLEKFSMVLLQITNDIYSPWKKKLKNPILFKLFWYKVFVYWRLKLLNFPNVFRLYTLAQIANCVFDVVVAVVTA